ncbi:MAG: LamG domain-containing protein, partial [Planctomycetota bacterium]
MDARGNAVVYRNGAPVKAGPVGVPARVMRVSNYIGKGNWDDPHYKGRMDDVRIYNRALGPALVRELASGRDARVAARYLLGHWKFDDGAGTVARDSSGRGNHGQVLGATWAEGKVTTSEGAPSAPRRPSAEPERAVEPTRGLVGHWKFDERAGTTARDSSGRGNHGRITGGRRVQGKLGYALALDGVDDYVAIANEAAFDITGNITVAAWIKVASFTKPWQAIVTKGDGSWRLQRDLNKSSLGWVCTGVSHNRVGSVVGDMPVDDGRWHHVAGVYDGTRTYLYVDGKVDASTRTSGAIQATDYPVCIGHNAQQEGRQFRGLIDDVRIYTRALSSDEMRALAEARATAKVETPPPAPPPTVRTASARGLVGHWKFDEGRGTTARDSSGEGHHGAVKGGARWARGKVGNALFFDGEDDHVAIPDKAAFDITGNITVAAWIKVASFTKEFQAIITKGDRSWRLHRDRHKRNLEWACTGLSHRTYGDLSGSSAVDDGRWHHVAGVYDGTRTYLYVDGKVDASVMTSGAIRPADHPICIGHNAARRGRHFHGLIDDVRIYERALSAAEVRALAGGKVATVAATETPPPPPAKTATPGTERNREPLGRLLSEFDSLVGKGDYAGAASRIEKAVTDAAFADFTDEMVAALGVCEALAA